MPLFFIYLKSHWDPVQEYIDDVPPSPPSPPSSPLSPPKGSAAASSSVSPAGARRPPALVKVEARKPFVFISTFKWEMRKGWDKLVHAYLQVRRRWDGYASEGRNWILETLMMESTDEATFALLYILTN